MEQIVITLDIPEITEIEKKGDKEAIAKVLVLDNIIILIMKYYAICCN